MPDGIYDFVGNTIEQLSSIPRTSADLENLSKILREAAEKRATKDELINKIEKETKIFGPIIGLIADSKGDLYAFIGLILTVITILQSMVNKESTMNVNVENVLSSIFEAGKDSPQKKETDKPKLRSAVPKVGRNDKCPCGSGKKYKRCHGEII